MLRSESVPIRKYEVRDDCIFHHVVFHAGCWVRLVTRLDYTSRVDSRETPTMSALQPSRILFLTNCFSDSKLHFENASHISRHRCPLRRLRQRSNNNGTAVCDIRQAKQCGCRFAWGSHHYCRTRLRCSYCCCHLLKSDISKVRPGGRLDGGNRQLKICKLQNLSGSRYPGSLSL